jgi:kojibiose phosphorylase
MRIGYIFDFDGVLVNTMEAHFSCNKQALAEEVIPIDKAQFFFQAGMTGKEQISYFAEKAGKSVDIEKIYQRKGELYKSFIDKATLIKENLQLLQILHSCGVPIAIASGSSHKSIDPVMKRFNIVADAIVTCADVSRGKPHPDLFLKAAEKLGLSPSECIVIEDSDVGIEAALNAGMKAMRFYENKKV